MPLLVAPAFADRPPQPMLLLGVGDGITRLGGREGRKQHTRLQLEVRERPKRRDAAHAKLPDMPLGRMAQHRRTLVAPLRRRDLYTDRGLVFGDGESNSPAT